MTALCSLFSESTISSIPNVIDGGDATACEFLAAVLSFTESSAPTNANANANMDATTLARSREQWKFQSNAQLKKFLADGKLIPAILDLLSHSTQSGGGSTARTTTLYAKISAIQSLSKLTSTNPTLIHSQILSAPDGLHRIIDLLNPAPIEEESIRNEALLLCRIMAETNAGSARLMIFGEAYKKVFEIAMDDSVGYAVRGDCLKLCIEMTRQDEMGVDVFLGDGTLVMNLIRFLDLRMGKNFTSPEEELHGDADDLDDILNLPKKGGDDDKDGANGGKDEKKKAKVPFLTEEEESVTLLALELMMVLIVGDGSGEVGSVKMQARQKSVLGHDGLSRFLIDMALYTLPPPDSPHHIYLSAVPTLRVQMRALDVMATLALGSGDEAQEFILSRRGVYLNAGVLDRVMYLICTGDGANRGPDLDGGANKISMHCLGVLRCLLSAKEASMMMMHTLAPPPPENDEGVGMPIEVPVVRKLVNTLGENLHVLLSADIRKELKDEDMARISRMIIGAAGALGIFFTNGAGETTREMILRVPMPPPPPPSSDESTIESEMNTPPPSLMECVISYIEFCSNDAEVMSKSIDVVAALLRLTIEWVPSTPKVISELLSSPSSISLGILLQQKFKKSNPPTTQALSAVLLGLCMDNMKIDDEMGGWSIASIMNLINVGLGIGKYTQLLESLKSFMTNDDGDGVGPWACCLVERNHFKKWYKNAVNIVRKRTVQELTTSAGNDSDSEMEEAGEAKKPNSRDAKAMKKLVSQQTAEIDALRVKLAEAEESLLVHSTEAKTLKKRLESNPSQLDDLMNECTSKISELEVQNRSLSSKISDQEKNMKEIIKHKDAATSQLQRDLDQARGEVNTLIEDKKVMQEEVEGLTSAYTTLENEFNRLSSSQNGSSQTNGDATSEGSMSTFASQMMKDENAKLKNNMRAANTWMKEAVKKHDELTKRNIALEAELKTARLSSGDASRVSIDLESLKLSLSATERNLESVTSEREQLKADLVSLQQKLSIAENNEHHNSINAQAHNEIANLTNQIEEMKQKISTDSKQYAASVAGLEQSLVSKDQIISGLETRLQEADFKVKQFEVQSQGHDAATEEEKVKLQNEVMKLTTANKSAQEWMANAVKRHSALKKQVQDLQSTNSKLQSDLEKQGTNGHSESASLRREVENVSRERDMVRNQMVDIEAKFIDLQTVKEKRAAEYSQELHDLKTRLNESQQETKALMEKATFTENEFTSERQRFLDDLSKLKLSLQEKENEVASLSEELSNAKRESEVSGSEFDEHNDTISQLIAERQKLEDERDNLIAQREEHLVAIEDMKNRLTEFHSWTETAQQRIAELETEKETSESRIEELEVEFERTRTLLNEARSQLEEHNHLSGNLSVQAGGEGTDENQLKADLSAAREEVTQVQSQLQRARDEYETLKSQSIATDTELNKLREEVSGAHQRIADLENEKNVSDLKIQGYEQRAGDYEDLQIALQHSKDEVESLHANMKVEESAFEQMKLDLSTAKESFAQLEEKFEISQNQLRELEAERESSNSKIQELIQNSPSVDEAELNTLRSKVSELEMQLGDFDGRNRALAEENRALEESNTIFKGKAELLDEVEENLFEKEHEVSELSTALSALRQEIADLQEESEMAIASWKGTYL